MILHSFNGALRWVYLPREFVQFLNHAYRADIAFWFPSRKLYVLAGGYNNILERNNSVVK